MRTNKGFTYYELLIVIAIMSLMVGFTSIGIGTAYRNNVNRWADKVESSAKQARNFALSKGSDKGFMNIYRSGNKLYVYVGEKITANPVDLNAKDWELIASNVDDVHIRFDTGLGSVSMPINSGALANIAFKQSTGEVAGLTFPYAGSTKYISDLEINIGKGNNDATVLIKRYGSISIE